LAVLVWALPGTDNQMSGWQIVPESAARSTGSLLTYLRDWLRDLADAFGHDGGLQVSVLSDQADLAWVDPLEDAARLNIRAGGWADITLRARLVRADHMVINVAMIVRDDGTSTLARLTVVDPELPLSERRRYGWHLDATHPELGICHEHVRDSSGAQRTRPSTVRRIDQLLGPIRAF